MVLVLPATVWANAAPPGDFRFEFEYQIPVIPQLQGAQLLTCLDDSCAEPILLGAFGDCSDGACLPLPPPGMTPVYPQRAVQPIECTQQACLADASEGYGNYRLLLQFSDGMRESRVFGGTSEPYRVIIREEGLVLRSPMADPYGFLVSSVIFLPNLILTWLVESIVVWFVLARSEVNRRSILLWLIPLHLATIPVVWFLFPALSWSPTLEARTLWPLALGMVLFVSIAAVAYGQDRLSRASGTLLILLGIVALPGFTLVLSRTGVSLPPLDLAPWVTTALSELFIFLFEAWVFVTVARGRLGAKLALLASLLANVASWSGGQLLLAIATRL